MSALLCGGASHAELNSCPDLGGSDPVHPVSQAFGPVLVPKGRSRIAQRFNAGFRSHKTPSPEGTAESRPQSPRPALDGFKCPLGTGAAQDWPVPALKRRAIVMGSLRDEGPLEFPKGIAAIGLSPPGEPVSKLQAPLQRRVSSLDILRTFRQWPRTGVWTFCTPTACGQISPGQARNERRPGRTDTHSQPALQGRGQLQSQRQPSLNAMSSRFNKARSSVSRANYSGRAQERGHSCPPNVVGRPKRTGMSPLLSGGASHGKLNSYG